MSLPVFSIGDEVIFIRDNSDGGSSYGAEGSTAVIKSVKSSRGDKVTIQRTGSKEWDTCWAYKKDLQHNFKPYIPSQEGDRDDDV